jgi:hypothetical protein
MSGLYSHGIEPPPARCRVIVEEHADGFTITIPARGLVRGGGCAMVFFTPLVIGLAALLAVNSYYHIPTHRGVPQPEVRYVPPVLVSLVSILLVLAMVNRGWRRAVVAVVGGKLRVEGAQPFFGTKRGEWERSQLFAICAGPDCLLEIYPRSRPPFTLFYPGPGLELEWLADVLRRGLQLDTRPTPRATAGEAVVVGPAGAGGPADWVVPGAEPDDNWMWISAGCVGVLLVTILWWVFAIGSSLMHLPWPLSSIWAYAVAGAAVGISCALLYRGSRRRYVRQLPEISRSMDFAFQPAMSREDIGDFFDLRLFRGGRSSARNRMTGMADGLPVDMFDYTFSVGSGRSQRTYRQTVMLLPAPEEGLPAFELRPQHGDWLVSGAISFVPDHLDYGQLRKRLGKQGYQLFLREHARSRPTRECIERFSRHYAVRRYYLSEYFEQAAVWKFTGEAGTGLGPDRAGREEDIRTLFTLNVLRYFADHPGWRIESDGRHLALWRSRRFLSAAKRPRFVAEALEVYRVFTHAGNRATTGTGGSDTREPERAREPKTP